MSAPLYGADILRLAASVPSGGRLAEPMGTAERRATLCGSRVAVDVDLDAAGRVEALGMEVRACALGQASAALLARDAAGRTAADLAAARDAVAAWMAGAGDAPDWPGVEVLAPARAHPARHAAVRLPFEAAAEAAASCSPAEAGVQGGGDGAWASRLPPSREHK